MKYIDYLEKIKGFSDKTIKSYGDIAGKLDWYGKDYKKYIMSLPTYSTNTRRLIFSGIISYYKFLNDERWKEIKLPKKDFKHKAYVSFEEYKKFLEKINHKTNMGKMKRLVVRILFETGIRASELLDIRKKDINKNEIKIYGKGRRERIVKISDWLLDELNQHSKEKTDYIFNFKYKNLYKKVQTLSNKKVTPHMFRRGYAKYCYENGIPIYDISLSMGHSSIETTSNYIKKTSVDVNIYKIF